ncbi:DNA cytosine methyltransferase [Candidatus Saccharibacteria bacterium]|nr:DNA cytosine methyltransferase [Candidatus Saccharibacteria bacterium]
MKVLELFGGIGACSAALKRLGFNLDIEYVEIDRFAVQSFNAIHGTSFVPTDVREWDKDIEVDLIMHGSPCQDFSVAGLNKGGDEGSGTRSSLMYETLHIVEKLRPKYVIWENVKNLLSAKHRHNFDAYQARMVEFGYNNHYQVLNACDYGIPQNRERVFTISIRNDLPDTFVFPEKQPLTTHLSDILEENVDEKYYLSEKALDCFLSDGTGNYPRRERFFSNIFRKNQNIGNSITTNAGSRPTDNFVVDDTYRNRKPRVYSEVSPTLRSSRFGLKVSESIVVASRGRDPENPSRRTAGGAFKQRLEPRLDGITNTLTTVQKDNLIAELRDCRIRKLTPRECWRLMGFSDEDFDKASKVCSNTQLYRQAGNSIVVNVLEAILRNLLF